MTRMAVLWSLFHKKAACQDFHDVLLSLKLSKDKKVKAVHMTAAENVTEQAASAVLCCIKAEKLACRF